MKKTADIVYEEIVDHNRKQTPATQCESSGCSDKIICSDSRFAFGEKVLAYYAGDKDWVIGELLDEDTSGEVPMYKVKLQIGLTLWTRDIAPWP